ncbi:MAG: Dabb family protein [Rhodobacterales bacterium]|nr:Dabb family protein [Rhodobacterales bacterium]NCT11302.1 Dabb family protein [Rhodobacterales bacterium]
MIAHVVMMRLAPGHDTGELAAVMEGLGQVMGRLSGALGFEHGVNRDYENLSPGWDAGFICRFTDAAALATYAADPEHRALSQRLLALCAGGLAGLMVIDLDV